MIQKAYKYILYTLGGVLFLGALLDSISNAVSLITPKVTYWGTGIIILSWLVIEIYAKRKGILWNLPGDSKITIRGLNHKIGLFAIGLIISLWIPIVLAPSNENPLVLKEASTFPFDDTTSNLKVLLLPFKPDINCTELDVNYRSQLLERLRRKKDGENLSLRFLMPDSIDCPLSDDEAKEIGREKNADLVIWGNYEESIKGIESLRVRYTLTNDFDVDPSKKEGDTEMQPLEKLHQLRQGYLQNDIDYVIYWIEGMSAFKQGNYKQAISKFDEVIEISLNDSLSVDTYLRLGQLYFAFGRGKKSLFYFRRALSIQQLAEPPSYVNIARTYTDIGAVLTVLQHKNNDALTVLDSALVIQREMLDSLHPDLAKTYLGIGAAHAQNRNLDEALHFFQKSQTIREFALDSLHPSLARVYTNIGNVYLNKRDFDTGIEFYQKAITIQEAALGKNHPDLTRSYSLLGVVMSQRRDHRKSIEYHEMALTRRLNILDPLHPDLARTYFHLGGEYSRLGEYKDALSYSHQALKIQEQVLDSLDIELAKTYLNIGAIYGLEGNHEKSIPYYHRALAIQKASIDSLNPNLANIYINLGVSYLNQDDSENSLNCYQKAVEIFVASDSLHPNLAVCYMNIGEIHTSNEDYAVALDYLNKSKEIIKTRLGDTNAYMASCERYLAKCYNGLNQLSIALSCIKRSFSIFSTIYPADHTEVVNAKELMAEIEKALKES